MITCWVRTPGLRLTGKDSSVWPSLRSGQAGQCPGKRSPMASRWPVPPFREYAPATCCRQVLFQALETQTGTKQDALPSWAHVGGALSTNTPVFSFSVASGLRAVKMKREAGVQLPQPGSPESGHPRLGQEHENGLFPHPVFGRLNAAPRIIAGHLMQCN